MEGGGGTLVNLKRWAAKERSLKDITSFVFYDLHIFLNFFKFFTSEVYKKTCLIGKLQSSKKLAT